MLDSLSVYSRLNLMAGQFGLSLLSLSWPVSAGTSLVDVYLGGCSSSERTLNRADVTRRSFKLSNLTQIPEVHLADLIVLLFCKRSTLYVSRMCGVLFCH